MAARPWASSSRRGGFLESLGSRLGHKGWVGGREEEEGSVVELGRLVVHRWKAGGPRMGGVEEEGESFIFSLRHCSFPTESGLRPGGRAGRFSLLSQDQME